MGAEFNVTRLRGATMEEAIEAGKIKIDKALYDYGHAGYTGSFAECDGVEPTTEKFESVQKAKDWLLDNAAKWGPMLIVQAVENDQPVFIGGAWCSS